MAFRSTQISWTTDSSEFERQCCVLLGDWLDDPSPLRFSTAGASQDGVDMLCRRAGDPDHLVGVQCKLRSEGGKLSVGDLRKEVRKALGFDPPLKEYYVATTLRAVKGLQQAASRLAQEQATAGRTIEIQVWGADALNDRIQQSAKAKEAFDPEASPALARNTEALLKVDAGQDQLADLTRTIANELGRQSNEHGAAPAPLAGRILQEELTKAFRRRGFVDCDPAAELEALAKSAADGELRLAATTLRAEACDQAARALALTRPDDAEGWVARAAQLDPSREMSIAQALLLEAP